ncbi:MAG: hypothetical protein AAF191_03855 [Verrucomicrobiota bacterium]
MGTFGFGLISTLSYGIWAFGRGIPELPLYALIALAFLGLTIAVMHRVWRPDSSWSSFAISFLAAFLTYAVIWSAGWFLFRGPAGEIFGSALGLAGFAAITLGRKRESLLEGWALLFLFHTLGYTLGSLHFDAVRGKGLLAPIASSLALQPWVGQLLWGWWYGLGFGLGMSLLYRLARTK